MRVRIAVLAALVSTLAALPAGAAKPPGVVIARASGAGKPSLAVAHGQVDRPKALYARLTGRITQASVLVECLVGTEATPATYVRRRPGLYRFPVRPAPADVCHVTATVDGRGRIAVELRAVR